MLANIPFTYYPVKIAILNFQLLTKFTGSVLKSVSGKKGIKSRSIIRLDQEPVWTVDGDKKE